MHVSAERTEEIKMIYYADNVNGTVSGNGLSPEDAVLDYTALALTPGDTVLLKRGNVYRSALRLTPGEKGSPVTYGAYGEGEDPTFAGGTDVSLPTDWKMTETENVWECVKPTRGSVGNFVFNGGECTATLRWEKEDLVAQGDFYDSYAVEHPFSGRAVTEHLYLYSVGNPASVYKGITAIDYGDRQLCTNKDNVCIDGLTFKNTSVHAIAGDGARNVTVRNCHFENIGGGVWNHGLRIRFGNAVEFWTFAENILIEKCTFKNIYDSCITHQGPGNDTLPAVNLDVYDCVFDTYGMAAFEYRDKMPINSHFSGNVCRGAGTGFALLGETPPRRSEIWPQPMGHHIFLWRIEDATEGGSVTLENNVFGDAPIGAAVYSIIDRRAEAQLTFKNNRYTRNDTLLVRFNGECFNDLESYKAKCGNDEGSEYID